MKFGVRGQLTDVITCIQFLVDRFRGYGVLTPPKLLFPIDLLRHPYNSVALPCDTVIVHELLLFEGHTAGPHVNKGGNTANFLCLHSDPQWGTVFDGHQASTGSIYGASYGMVYSGNQKNDVFS